MSGCAAFHSTTYHIPITWAVIIRLGIVPVRSATCCQVRQGVHFVGNCDTDASELKLTAYIRDSEWSRYSIGFAHNTFHRLATLDVLARLCYKRTLV